MEKDYTQYDKKVAETLMYLVKESDGKGITQIDYIDTNTAAGRYIIHMVSMCRSLYGFEYKFKVNIKQFIYMKKYYKKMPLHLFKDATDHLDSRLMIENLGGEEILSIIYNEYYNPEVK